MPEKIVQKLVVGDKVGRLTILEIIRGKTVNCIEIPKKARCMCDCGNETTMQYSSLAHGYTRSCGCIRRERLSTHKMIGTPEYRIWCSMKSRCNNKNTISSKYYSERGVKVCNRWTHSFENFYQDMGPRPTQDHSIDRIDSNGNYEPSNCTWSTSLEQSRNRRFKKRLGCIMVCPVCSKHFYVLPSKILLTKRCSIKCRSIASKHKREACLSKK